MFVQRYAIPTGHILGRHGCFKAVRVDPGGLDNYLGMKGGENTEQGRALRKYKI